MTTASAELAAELLGHTDTKITVQHYIRRRELVNPATAELRERVFVETMADLATAWRNDSGVYPATCTLVRGPVTG
jgi:hypothetical protein